jgi:hypothetical protein
LVTSRDFVTENAAQKAEQQAIADIVVANLLTVVLLETKQGS